jgi:hypothetical protein
MRKSTIILTLAALFSSNALIGQDTVFNRVVTVERDFQPDVKTAYKMQITPLVFEDNQEATKDTIKYSSYSIPLLVDYNLHPLKAAQTDFTPIQTLKGNIEGGVGHRNSHMAFDYRITDVPNMSLDLYAKHNAYWGRDALSESNLGMQLVRNFKKIDMFFELDGGNEFFTYYGRYFDGTNKLTIPVGTAVNENQSIWNISANVGFKTKGKSAFTYAFQTGYKAYIATDNMVENQLRTNFDMTWKAKKKHAAGVKFYMQNSMYSNPTKDSTLHNKHALRLEPYYEYKHKAIRLHAGVNIGLNIGTGKLISAVDNVCFAPTPNIEFEWKMMDNIFHIYANAKGSMGVGSVEEYLGYNRYLNIQAGKTFNDPRNYTPADLQVGFKIRPVKTMLLDIYGGYAYTIGANQMYAILDTNNISVIDYSLQLNNLQCWKVGASLHYHYRDMINLSISGNYYAYSTTNSITPQVYDRPSWDLYGRVDVKIDNKWSCYSENYFAGKRIASTTLGDIQLKPTIELNLGAQYTINNWLNVYVQLNNFLNRKNDIFYGYQSQGCHFIGGVKYKF